MHVTIGQLRSALGDLSGPSVASNDQRMWFTRQANQLLADAKNMPLDRLRSVVSSADALRSEIAKYQSWSEEKWCINCYSSSQTIKDNIYVAKNNALVRIEQASGSSTRQQLAPMPQSTSMIVETVRELPSAVAARAEELAKGDVWTEEQRQVVGAPLKAVGVAPSSVPAATATSIDSSPAPGWWSAAIDWVTGASAQAAATAASSAPLSLSVKPATQTQTQSQQQAASQQQTASQQAASQATTQKPPVQPSAVKPTTPTPPPAPRVAPPEQPQFSAADALNIAKSITSAASIIGGAFAEGQTARATAAASRPTTLSVPSPTIPFVRPHAQHQGIGATEAIVIGLGFVAVAGAIAFVVMSDDDSDE